ncbi:SEC1 family transport SLY1-like [Micractinium conductrix]|uniref:SEC1 family transport SLY1-like n=1 Tax=Micractinium conductrix TaxID=554055 RepID=A0A2P6VA81_9CHLO|nr:SEC1 family transport SLY1-like [Micractinium conductrix]|eukprot:PSC71004.1 SEC1 family transport SLY1-like [Micractinium conductrix]
MLHFNAPPAAALKAAAGGGEEDVYKVLVLDRVTKDILAPLLHVNELRRHGVTLHLLLDADRQPIPDVPAVYYVHPNEASIQRVLDDLSRGLYASFHLNFSTHIPRPLMEKLAAGVVASNSAARVARLYDQHGQFLSLEGGLFTLGLPDTYLQLNDPAAQDTQIEAAVSAVVEGLFCVLATLGVVPVIRCPRGGAAEHVAAQLDAKLRDALAGRSSLFSEAGAAGAGGLAASLQRPLLCLFDRNFELSVVLQHAWTYKPLVHDVLAMRLNRVTLQDAAPAPGQPGGKKSYEVDDNDFFWAGHGKEQFPKIAEQVEVELKKYKDAIEELNRKTGSHIDPLADPSDLMRNNTRSLMNAVSSLPELTEKKRVIDKHTNLATALLGAIKARQLDAFYSLEEDCLGNKADAGAVVQQLQAPVGTPADKLRLALVWLLTCESGAQACWVGSPPEGECQQVEALLQGCGADMAAWWYVKRMRRLNLTGKQQPGAASVGEGLSGFGGAAQSQLTTLLGSTFGQGLSSLTKGVKNLLAGEQQAAVTVAVEALMEGRPNPETDAYAVFDPKAPAGRAQRPAGPFKESLVFMLGGGNYLEYESLSCWASRAQPTPKHIVYGATDLLAGEQVLQQLSILGHKSGAAPAAPAVQ